MALHIEHSHTHETHQWHDHSTHTFVFLKVFGLLILLLFTTVAAAGIDLTKDLPIHIPGMNVVVMLLIATIKASLVVLYFMEVKKGTKLTWLWAATGFVWVLLIFLILGDYLTRGFITVNGW